MDIYQVIESDNALTRSLINRILVARNPEWRYEVCCELAQVVRVHARAKRLAFYRVIAAYPEIAGRVERTQEELDIAENFLKEALTLNPEEPGFMRLFHEARAELEHGMAIDTGEIFDWARTALDKIQAVEIGQRMRALKDEFIEADYMGSPALRADAGYYS